MDVSTTLRFLATNVTWPQDKKFFLPEGGLVHFLETNLHFKVLLVMMTVFTDGYATETVKLLTTPQLAEIRTRMKDLVRHMFYATEIRHNKFRVTYEPGPIPAEAAWMFHVILTLLTVVGFDRFFLDEEERAHSEASSGSMPDLASVSASEDSDMGVFEIVKTARTILDGGPGIGARVTINRIADSNIICARKVHLKTAIGGTPFQFHIRAPFLCLATPMLTCVQVGAYRLILSHLTLSHEQLLDRSYQPDVPLSDYFRRRIHPCVYFLQRCLTGSAGSEGPVLDLPPSELEEIQFHLVILLGTIRLLGRARFWALRRVRSSNRGAAAVLEDVKFYTVPSHACEMFAILLRLIVMSWLEQEHPIPVAVARPIVLDFLLTANAIVTVTQGPRDFPEYNADGLLGKVAGAFVFPPLD
ncbi:hypothetical protein C8R44DRAFT_733820 [Mycena epipterygia]|nr:hypothetical protein C8R44DRAFT_733820 [Mycena epipterygia]